MFSYFEGILMFFLYQWLAFTMGWGGIGTEATHINVCEVLSYTLTDIYSHLSGVSWSPTYI